MKQLIKNTKNKIQDMSQKVPRLSSGEKKREFSLKLGDKEWDKIFGNLPVFL